MANGFIELAAQSGGQKVDSESLTVEAENVDRQRGQIAGAADVEIARVSNAVLANNAYGLGVREITQRSAIQSLHAAQVLDNAPTFANSSLLDVSAYTLAAIYLNIAIANNPTSLQVIHQFSDDAGTTWFDYKDLDRLFTDMSLTPILVCYQIPLIGGDFRLRIVGKDTTASDTLTVTASAELYK